MTSAIPLTVITGFLGSGKTTLLKALLPQPEMAGTAVIVNEFGEIGLDDALLETAEEDTVLLPSGCVCCAVRGDLVQALIKLHKRMLWGEIPPLKRVVLETTGLADPAPIVHTLINDHDVFRIYRMDGIVTTVDAEHGLHQLDHHYEPAKQIAIADRIVLTKTDRVGAPDVERLTARVRTLNPAARLLPAVKGGIAPSELFGLGAYEIKSSGIDIGRWVAAEAYGHAHEHACTGDECTHPHHHHDHDHDHDHDHNHGGHLHGISSFCLTFDKPLDARKLEMAIELLRSAHGERLLRVKGLLDVADHPQPFVIHGVQHVFYPPETLERWPAGDRRSRIVFITKDLGEDKVRAVFEPLFASAPAS